MELREGCGERPALASWSGKPDKVISSSAAFVLEEQKRWVHPLVSFSFDGFSKQAGEQQLEAAE